MQHTIFYSWQSDTRAAANRSLIQNALELAIKELQGKNKGTIINPVIDRDTSGIPGSPDISSTIFNKIDNSSVVVADVTLVDNELSTRRFPNPNILIEVGYAIKSLGFSRVLLVQNTFFGPVENLPFDIRGKRVMTYSSDPSAKTRKNERDLLIRQLKNALISILPILEDKIEEDNSLDFDVYAKNINDLSKTPSENTEEELSKIAEQIISAERSSPDNRTYLLNHIVHLWRSKNILTKEFLYDLSIKSIQIHPTSSAYFNIGLLAGSIGRHYDSISAYMKAIDLGDPNPSLCYLNSGNRFKELNYHDIAISFYEKSIKLNPRQINAILAAAQLYDLMGNISLARKSYEKFLDLYREWPINSKTDTLKQQAEQAEYYLKTKNI